MDDKTRTEIMKLAVDLIDKGNDKNNVIHALYSLYPDNNPKTIEFMAESAIDMLKSFSGAVYSAGGSGWPLHKLLRMTFLDLLSHLSTNGIRFTWNKK